MKTLSLRQRRSLGDQLDMQFDSCIISDVNRSELTEMTEFQKLEISATKEALSSKAVSVLEMTR